MRISLPGRIQRLQRHAKPSIHNNYLSGLFSRDHRVTISTGKTMHLIRWIEADGYLRW